MEVLELYKRYGSHDYIGEKISQLEHAIQAAMLAEKDNQSKEIILAALLHDIGHLVALNNNNFTKKMNGLGVFNHETIGKEYLIGLGFKYPIPQLVENHVVAKRYIISKTPDYYFTLTDASKKTLKLQGGPLTFSESISFENNPLFEASIIVRNYDDNAKVKGKKIRDVKYYENMLYEYLQIRI